MKETTLPSELYIYATNVHQGGGRALLEPIIRSIHGAMRSVVCVDERMPIPNDIATNVQVKRVKPSLFQRLYAERWLAHTVAPEDTVLCFGNLPPLFRLRGHTMVFVQNRYLIDDISLNGFPFCVRLRLTIERLWLSGKMSNADEFIVQTPTMKRLLESKTRGSVPVRVLPFVAQPEGYARSVQRFGELIKNRYDFVYVASGEPHKNHRRLMEAWCLLAKEGVFPALCLTLDESRFADLCGEIKTMSQCYGLKVENAGSLSHQDVLSLYKNAEATIYPSIFESFGLPLIEARQEGLPVLASEMDYVRDVLDPEQSFDPESAISIARAVKRFLQVDESPLPLLDASMFLNAVVGVK